MKKYPSRLFFSSSISKNTFDLIFAVEQKLSTMKFNKKGRFFVLELILYMLIISNAIIPVLCMDGDKTTKGILNSDLPTPGADIPIIDLSLTTPTKSSTNYSKVCKTYTYFYFRNSY